MISVILCTRNRCAPLQRALSTVAGLSFGQGCKWELIVVDNGSTDFTKEVVETFAAGSRLDIRYVFEGRKGLSHARNAGIGQARGEIIAFIDDDMVLQADWLEAIARESSARPDVSMFFGQTRAMRPELAKLSVKEDAAEKTYVFPSDPGEPGCGNNMMLRKETFAKVGEFDVALGAGSTIGSSEDTDYTYRVLRAGGLVAYCPSILAYHDHDRVSSEKIRRLLFDYGRGRGGFYGKHILKGDGWAVKNCFWEVQCFCRKLLRKDETIRAFLHLIGMSIGFSLWIAFKSKEFVFGSLRRTKAPGTTQALPQVVRYMSEGSKQPPAGRAL